MVKLIKQTTIIILLGVLVFPSCSKEITEENPGVFNPEIVNLVGNFELHATDVSNVSENLEYLWINTGSKAVPEVKANIDNSSGFDKGSATIKIFDAHEKEVFSGDLSENGSSTTSYGFPGTWNIKIALSEVSGDLNIKIEEE